MLNVAEPREPKDEDEDKYDKVDMAEIDSDLSLLLLG